MADWKKKDSSYGGENKWFIQKVKMLFNEDPVSFIGIYLSIALDNMIVPDYISWSRFPEHKQKLAYYSQRNYKINKIILGFTILGFIFLLINQKVFAAILLILLYVYFALISGFTYWQGSRIFYPAQVASAIFVASAIYYPSSFIWDYLCRLWRLHLGKLSLSILMWIKKIVYWPNKILTIPKDKYRNFLIFCSAFLLIILIVIGILIPLMESPKYQIISFAGNQVFGEKLVLSQVRLEEKDGTTQAIIFDFYPLTQIEDDYRVYFHIFPAGGKMINRDFAPDPPIPFWQLNFIYSQRIKLDLSHGEYDAIIGIFFNQQKYLGEPVSFKINVK